MKKYTDNNRKKDNNVVENINSFNDIRIDNTKSYIYFTDEDMISEEFEISFPKVVINFNDTNNIAAKLNSTTEVLLNETKYDDAKNLKYAHYPIYTINNYDNYVSLICEYYIFENDDDPIVFKKGESYVFDKYTGELYTSGRLLNLFNLSVDKVKEKVKNYINDMDLINGEETLDVDATISNLSMDYLYVNKLGKLSIGIIVKSSEKDYNEIVVLS